MALVENTKVSSELNFGERESSYPVYHYRNLYPTNGAERTLTLTSAAAAQTTIFSIPAEQVNMGESYLQYDLMRPAQGAGAYAWVFKDVYGEFDSLVYRDTGTQYLTNLRNVNIYNAVMARLDTSPDDLLFNDGKIGLVSANAAGTTAADNLRPDDTNKSLLYKEPVNLQVSAANTALTIRRRIYLKYLAGKHTYLGMAKDSLFPQETYLEIGLIGIRIGYANNSATNPSAGIPLTPTNMTALTGNITVSNITLKLAVQQNQDIIQKMKQEVANGPTIPIPWTQVHAIMAHAGAQATYNLPLDKNQHGHKLQRIIYVPYASASPVGGQMFTVYDHINANDGVNDKIVTYNTELDSAKLQRDDLNISNYDDYMVHRRLLKNTTYFNQNIYNYYWVHIDDFNYTPETNKNEDGSIYTDGFTLDKPVIWTINKRSGNNNAIYNFTIVQGQKLLTTDSASFLVK